MPWLTLTATIALFLIFGSFLRRRHQIHGKKVVSPRFLAWKLRLSRKASKIKIKNVPLVLGSETQHIMITGGTGSGKTNCLHHLLKQIRNNRQKAVVIDTTGMFVEKYFRADKDFILNPTHPKSEEWHPWAECENRLDFDELSECFIPQTHLDSENYWRQAAKSFFSTLMEKLSNGAKTSDLTRWILYEPLQNLAGFLEGTRAAAHIDLNTERTAGSVRSVACSYLECLNYLKDTATPFSIKKWM
jgi:type IV secretory pathway TraG/TraD family ATPase VirD4